MAGSALAGRLLAPSVGYIPVERYMQIVFAASAVALFVPVIFNRTYVPESNSLNIDAPGYCSNTLLHCSKQAMCCHASIRCLSHRGSCSRERSVTVQYLASKNKKHFLVCLYLTTSPIVPNIPFCCTSNPTFTCYRENKFVMSLHNWAEQPFT